VQAKALRDDDLVEDHDLGIFDVDNDSDQHIDFD
jgi:hypothetical protein